MNNDVKLPIETTREGNKITKVCVEDVYRLINRINSKRDYCNAKSDEDLTSFHKVYGEYEGELVIGKGISQPCITDAFDEEIGNNIAFMKAKLNANLKKLNVLYRVYNRYVEFLAYLDNEIDTIEGYVDMDLEGLRRYNPEYLIDKL